MPEPFKNFFNLPLIEKMAGLIKTSEPNFDPQRFIALASANLDALELKERSNQIKAALGATLSNDINISGPILLSTLGNQAPVDGGTTDRSDDPGLHGFAIMPLADFIAEIGIDEPQQSFDILEEMTKRFSAEFAVRPFIIKDPKGAMMRFATWAKSENAHVRRLASEGCRPLLPWGLRLHLFVKDPTPILPILDVLKDDPTEYVRRSVANNLNDIAKNQPELVAEIAAKWRKGASQNRERLVRHACRTLIKKGHKPTLTALGYDDLKAELTSFSLENDKIKLGEPLKFAFTLKPTANTPQPVILDYAIHFKKANGSTAPKVFKLKTGALAADKMLKIEKSHVIKKITTMAFYPGEHQLELLANGKSIGCLPFHLRVS